MFKSSQNQWKAVQVRASKVQFKDRSVQTSCKPVQFHARQSKSRCKSMQVRNAIQVSCKPVQCTGPLSQSKSRATKLVPVSNQIRLASTYKSVWPIHKQTSHSSLIHNSFSWIIDKYPHTFFTHGPSRTIYWGVQPCRGIDHFCRRFPACIPRVKHGCISKCRGKILAVVLFYHGTVKFTIFIKLWVWRSW